MSEDPKSGNRTKSEPPEGAVRTATGGWLMPFKPGQSGNPDGRPANPFKSEIFRQLDKDKKVEFVQAFVKKALDGDERAARLLLEYSVGKPALAEEDRDALVQGADGFQVLLDHFRARQARVVELERVEDAPALPEPPSDEK